MHKVIFPFFDLQDAMHEYLPGDAFPRKGLAVSTERLEELATSRNYRGWPVIEKVADSPEAKERSKSTRKRVKEDADADM